MKSGLGVVHIVIVDVNVLAYLLVRVLSIPIQLHFLSLQLLLHLLVVGVVGQVLYIEGSKKGLSLRRIGLRIG